jgi:hypothetical protein
MKLTDEEINEALMSWHCQSSFRDGIRFTESHYLPLVEAQEWLIIDTPEKQKAYAPKRAGDAIWCDGEGWVLTEETTMFRSDFLYRRRIAWNAVSDTPIPKGVPVWLKFEHSERPLVHSVGGIMSHPDWGPLTHWRYASIPAPPIDPERVEFEKSWDEGVKGFGIEKDKAFQIWQAARRAKG